MHISRWEVTISTGRHDGNKTDTLTFALALINHSLEKADIRARMKSTKSTV